MLKRVLAGPSDLTTSYSARPVHERDVSSRHFEGGPSAKAATRVSWSCADLLSWQVQHGSNSSAAARVGRDQGPRPIR